MFFVGQFKGAGKVYLQAVADTYDSYGFGFLHPSKQPEAAVAVLHNDVLSFYSKLPPTAGWSTATHSARIRAAAIWAAAPSTPSICL
jgi:hypothetical protein